MFGVSAAQASSGIMGGVSGGMNLFPKGPTSTPSQPATSIFGTSQPSTNLFGGASKVNPGVSSQPSLFSGAKPAGPTSNIFGGSMAQPSHGIIGAGATSGMPLYLK